MIDLARAFETAQRAVEAAAKVALPHFHRGVIAEKKADRSPVTAADRESEAAIIACIRESYPSCSILAEESGVDARDASMRWIIDPLDGTRGFTRGGNFWGPLVAMELEGEVVAGAMGLPALGEVYCAAKGLGSFKNGARVSLSSISDWSEATLSVGELQHLLRSREREGVLALIMSAASVRGYGDPAGAAMVLSGRAEVWLEAGVKTWDIAPMKILVEEAGGRFASFTGEPSIETGTAILAAPGVFEHVLRTIRAA